MAITRSNLEDFPRSDGAKPTFETRKTPVRVEKDDQLFKSKHLNLCIDLLIYKTVKRVQERNRKITNNLANKIKRNIKPGKMNQSLLLRQNLAKWSLRI